MAFRLLFREVKRPKLLNEQTIGTLNAHALWRGCAYVRMGTWSSLLPIGTTHVSFLGALLIQVKRLLSVVMIIVV